MTRAFLFSLLLLVVFSSFQCEKELYESKPMRLKLLASTCAHHVVQIQDSAFYDWGINWTNSQGTSYEHVFTVQNHCEFVRAGIRAGEEFTARVVRNAQGDGCVTCLAYLETPPLAHSLRVER